MPLASRMWLIGEGPDIATRRCRCRRARLMASPRINRPRSSRKSTSLRSTARSPTPPLEKSLSRLRGVRGADSEDLGDRH
jgi:hypothetical protein